MHRNTIYFLTAVVFLSFSRLLFSAPEPAIIPTANEWTANVVFTQPQQITVKLPTERKPQRFWYIILTITNNTDRDIAFYPACELMTDTFQLVPAYRDTQNIVFAQIKKRHRKKFPLLESLEFADNRILQGEDNTKDMVIIWPDFDFSAKNISLFVAGLSNETVAIDNPAYDAEADANTPAKLYLRKTLELQYAIGGDAKLRKHSRLMFKSKRWIMR